MIMSGTSSVTDTSNPETGKPRWATPAVACAGLLVLAACAYVLFRALVGMAPAGYALQTDLHVYRDAVLARLDGTPLYDFRTSEDLAYIYPPFAAILLFPLVWIPEQMADVLWTLCGASLTVLVGWLIYQRVPVAERAKPVKFLLSVALLLASSVTVLNLQWGQIGIFLTTLVLLDLFKVTGRGVRGVLIGIAGAVKLTPLIFIGYLLVTGRYRDAGRALASLFLATGLGWLVFPHDSATFWKATFASIDQKVALINGPDNQSLYGFLLKFAYFDDQRGTTRMLWVFAALLIGVAWLLSCRVIARRDETAAILFTGCVSLVVSPISWGHHLHWLILLGAWLWLRPSLTNTGPWIGFMTMLLLVVPPIQEDMPVQDNLVSIVAVNYRFLLIVTVCAGIWWLASRYRGSDEQSAMEGEPVLSKS